MHTRIHPNTKEQQTKEKTFLGDRKFLVTLPSIENFSFFTDENSGWLHDDQNKDEKPFNAEKSIRLNVGRTKLETKLQSNISCESEED